MNEIINELKNANIGEHRIWESINKKIKTEVPLDLEDIKYYSRLTRIYKNSTVTRRRIYHTKLSEQDEKPSCHLCKNYAEYYCNMNDQYFCITHVVGHDENEI